VCAAAPLHGAGRSKFVLQAAALRGLVGDWRQALDALRPLMVDPHLQREARSTFLHICNQHRCLAEAWPLFADERDIGEDAASPAERADWLRRRANMLMFAGMIDAAGNALAEAKLILQSSSSSSPSRLELDLYGSANDLLLASEQHQDALEGTRALLALGDLPPDVATRANLVAGLCRLGLGDDASALPVLTQLVSARHSVYGQRAVHELALLQLRNGDHAAARAALHRWQTGDLGACDEHALDAVACLTIADIEAQRPPFRQPGEVLASLRATLDWSLQQWDAVPPSVAGVAFLQRPVRRDLLSALFSLLLLTADAETAIAACLDVFIAAEARGSSARMQALRPRSFQELRNSVVPRNGVMLVYLPAFTRSHLFVVPGNGPMIARALASDTLLRRPTRLFRDQLAAEDAPLATLRALAAPLAAWCLPPDVQQLLDHADGVAIVGRELLERLPFECLAWRASWLGCEKAIWDVGSMLIAHANRSRPPTVRDLDLAVLAATAVSDRDRSTFGADAVPLSADALRGLTSHCGGGRVSILSPASAEDLTRGDAGRAKLALVFAHGVSNPRHSPPHCLLMYGGASDSGAVFADQIVDAADIVFLGSCAVDSGGARGGEDGGHRLGGAFRAAGARCVVVSEGNLALAPTLLAAEVMARELAAGSSAAKALQLARRAVATTPGREHPRHHCRLRLEGDGDWIGPATPPKTTGSTRRNAWLGAGGAVVIAFFVGRALRRRPSSPLRAGQS
jgi:hypothetical protein